MQKYTNAVKSLDNSTRKNTEKKQAKVKSISNNKFAIIAEFLHNAHPTLKFNQLTFKLEDEGKEVTQRKEQSMYVAMTSISPDHEKIRHSDWLLFLGSDHIKSYNPLADYCSTLDTETPTTGKIGDLAKCFNLDPIQGMTTQHVELLLKRWFIGLVASIFDDNHNPLFPVIVGPKGCGKTYLLRNILPESLRKYIANMELTGNHKEDGDLVCSFLIAFIDEMDTLLKRDAARIRALLSKDKFTYQPPYGKGNVTRKRLSSFFGASNELEIISDKRNNRRIIPICITNIGWVAFNAIDKDELFREAFKLFFDGEDWNLTREEIKLLDSLTGVNESKDFEAEILSDVFVKDADGFMFASEIAIALQSYANIKLNPMKVGKALAACGYERVSKRQNGQVRYGWKVRNIKAPFT